ncbi:MAG: hypothetical protein SPI30_04780 [Prevotella sp.]|nr:hypothetical protein [Prevotella sp.]
MQRAKVSFSETSGAETSVSVSGLSIAYSNGNMIATNSSGTTTIALTSLSKMYFSETSTVGIAINSVSETQPVTVYSVSGERLGTYTDVAALKEALRQGVYVIEANGETSKILVK